jgi:hypothetical protein
MAVLLLVISVAATIWWREREKKRDMQVQSAALQAQVQSLEMKLQSVGRSNEPIVSAVMTTHVETVAAPLRSNATADAAAKAASPALLQDPETRALMRKQQEQAFAKLAEKIVSKDFAQSWGLSPAQAAQVKDLVREKAVAGKDMLNAMLFDGLDDDHLAQRGRETKQRLADADAALRGVLGADGFDALKQQEQLLEIRDRVGHMREDLAAAEQPLAAAQQRSLVDAMNAERQAFSFRVDYSDPSKFDFEHIRDVFSEANLQTYFEDLQQLNARVLERAALFLSPAQVEQLKTSQENQIEQARLTVKMTTELFNKRRSN